jgi:hypothetical protein
MAYAQNDIHKNFAKLISAGFGMSEGEAKPEVLPFNAAILEGLASSDKAMGHHGK